MWIYHFLIWASPSRLRVSTSYLWNGRGARDDGYDALLTSQFTRTYMCRICEIENITHRVWLCIRIIQGVFYFLAQSQRHLELDSRIVGVRKVPWEVIAALLNAYFVLGTIPNIFHLVIHSDQPRALVDPQNISGMFCPLRWHQVSNRHKCKLGINTLW